MKITSCALMREERQRHAAEAVEAALRQTEVTLTVENREETVSLVVSPADTVASIVAHISNTDGMKAVHIGAPLGIILPATGLHMALGTVGGHPYSTTIRLLYRDTCIPDYIKRTLAECEEESCGRCVPCREGVRQLRTIMDAITNGRAGSGDVELLRDVADGISQVSHCIFGMGMGSMVLSALNAFETEFTDHAVRKCCEAMVCAKYVTYHILGACTACGECMDVCEEDAIQGKARFIHVIDQKLCTRCGKCAVACPQHVITQAGAVKPRTPPRPVPCGSWKLC